MEGGGMNTFRKGVQQYTTASASGKFQFYSSCVNWPRSDVTHGLIPMIADSRGISRETFLKHVCREDLQGIEESLGYDSHWKHGLTMAGDWAVSYHKSKLHGETVYFFKHSAIEYVFRRAA